MALNIRNTEADRLAAQVACLAGETKTDAVILALKERLQRSLIYRLDQIALRCAARPILDREQAEIARAAFARYGKGRHRASLNLGDCFSYALAQWLEQPLLFKGDDFCHTDLQPACPVT